MCTHGWDWRKHGTCPMCEIVVALVEEQALDEGLWFHATTMPEAYLQEALRRLHAAIEQTAT